MNHCYYFFGTRHRIILSDHCCRTVKHVYILGQICYSIMTILFQYTSRKSIITASSCDLKVRYPCLPGPSSNGGSWPKAGLLKCSFTSQNKHLLQLCNGGYRQMFSPLMPKHSPRNKYQSSFIALTAAQNIIGDLPHLRVTRVQ